MRALRTAALAVVTAGGVALAALPASAALINLTGGTDGVIPTGTEANDVLVPLGLGSSLDGYFGAEVNLSGASTLLVEFFGSEAGYVNKFIFGSSSFSTSGSTAGNSSATGSPLGSFMVSSAAGLLGFSFKANSGATTVVNGFNPTDTGVNFFASIVGNPTGTSGNSVWLFLDDNGAAPNDNHDDMAIRISAVPVPASLPFLLAALAGLGLIERRRRGRLVA